MIRLAGRSDNAIVQILSWPGMMLQRLTTREPDEKMVEVAIASVEAVFDWKAYFKETFDYIVTEEDLVTEVVSEDGEDYCEEKSEADLAEENTEETAFEEAVNTEENESEV